MKLITSSSPHIRSGETTRRLMGTVLLALLPTLAARYNQRYGADWTARDSVKDYADSPESLEELRQLLELRD